MPPSQGLSSNLFGKGIIQIMNLLELMDDLDHQSRRLYNNSWGKNHWQWKKGLTISAGYYEVLMPGHPRASRNYVKRSTLVMEKKIGRFLKSEEVVHHKDHDKMNDDPDNLILCRDQSEHQRTYHKDKERDANGRFT